MVVVLVSVVSTTPGGLVVEEEDPPTTLSVVTWVTSVRLPTVELSITVEADSTKWDLKQFDEHSNQLLQQSIT